MSSLTRRAARPAIAPAVPLAVSFAVRLAVPLALSFATGPALAARPGGDPPTLTLDSSFEPEEGASVAELFPGREIDGDGTLTLIDAPVRAGKRALRVFVDGKRSEVKANGAGGPNDPALRERWFGFSVFFPRDFVTSSQRNSVDIFFQIHERPDEGERWRSPPLAVYGQHDRVEVSLISDPNPISAGNPGRVEGGGSKRTIFSAPFIRGRWVDWVIHVKWSYGDDGLTEVWLDGKKVVRHEGPNCYNDKREMYLKAGLYHHDEIDHVHYLDELRMGDARASYRDVAPRGRKPRPPRKDAAAPRASRESAPGPSPDARP